MANSEFGPKRTLIKSAAWSLATRWGMRILGFGNTVVMARLILPEDYGIVAMAHLLVGLVYSLLDFGATTALLRKDKVSRAEIDSAWTLKIIQGIAMGMVIILAIPIATNYFEEPRISSILYVFAVCVIVSGFANIGLTLAQKNFEFLIEFKFQIIAKLLSVFATILAGWWLHDYRALVIGIATGYIGGAVLSFWVHPYRPRLNTSEIWSIWMVTRWLMVANVGGFVLRKSDEIVAARLGTTAEYGLYNVGSDLGQMATGEVGPAVLKSFLPVLAAMNGTVDEVNFAVLKTLRVVAAITLPLGFGLAAVSEKTTYFVLGSTWSGAAPYVALFSIVGAFFALVGPLTSLLTLRGRTRDLSTAVWIEFLLFALSSFALVPVYGILGLVYARLLGVITNLVFTLWLGSRACKFQMMPALNAIARPFLGSVMMYLAVSMMGDFWDSNILGLVAGVIGGALFFALWSILTWRIVGCPVGLESTLLEFIRGFIRRK